MNALALVLIVIIVRYIFLPRDLGKFIAEVHKGYKARMEGWG